MSKNTHHVNVKVVIDIMNYILITGLDFKKEFINSNRVAALENFVFPIFSLLIEGFYVI